MFLLRDVCVVDLSLCVPFFCYFPVRINWFFSFSVYYYYEGTQNTFRIHLKVLRVIIQRISRILKITFVLHKKAKHAPRILIRLHYNCWQLNPIIFINSRLARWTTEQGLVRSIYRVAKHVLKAYTLDHIKSDAVRKQHILFIYFRRNEFCC